MPLKSNKAPQLTVEGEGEGAFEGWEVRTLTADTSAARGVLESLFGGLQIFVAKVTKDGVVVESNQRFQPLPDFDPHALEDAEAAQLRIVLERVFSTGETLSCRFARRAHTHSRWFEHRIGPMVSDGGGPDVEFASWVVLEVTEHVKRHDRVTEHHRRRSLEMLAGGVAHDFNNLLTAILGNTESVLDDVSDDSPLRPPLDDVRRSAVRAAGLSRQLLAFSGKSGNEFALIDLGDTIEELRPTLSASLPSSTKLQWEMSADPLKVMADRAQLQHVLLQLILNASEALEGREGVVTVGLRREQLDDATIVTFTRGEMLASGVHAIIDVRDTGHGMDAETRRRMFDPFFTTRFVGRGMGLASSAGITQAHRGGIDVTTSREHGTLVRVALPVAPSTRDDERETTPMPNTDGNGRRILVVDDEAVVCRFTKRALEKFGFDVTCVESGADALAAYEEQPFDLVLLDMTMPKMSGEQTFTALRALDPHVRTILMSGYNAVEATRRFTSAGLAGFLEKPYSARKLVNKVEDVLRQTARRSQSS